MCILTAQLSLANIKIANYTNTTLIGYFMHEENVISVNVAPNSTFDQSLPFPFVDYNIVSNLSHSGCRGQIDNGKTLYVSQLDVDNQKILLCGQS